MKIFYKKDFQRVLGEKKKIQQDYEELLEKYDNNDYRYFEDYCKYKDKAERLTKKNEEYKTANASLESKIIELEAKVKQLNCTKGGFVRAINKLSKEKQELQEQLKESMTDKYIVRKVPEGKTPKGQTIRIKGSSTNSKIIKKIKED